MIIVVKPLFMHESFSELVHIAAYERELTFSRPPGVLLQVKFEETPSDSMSKTTKRKHVTKEALTEYYIPEGEEEIVKVSQYVAIHQECTLLLSHKFLHPTPKGLS